MKKNKSLYAVLGIITLIMVITGCSVSSIPLVQKSKNVQLNNVAINNILKNKSNSQLETKIAKPKAEITFNEWGYTYSIIENTDSSTEVSNSGNILNSESINEGKDEERPEIILQWSDAQKTLDKDKLHWLNNEYLNSYAEDIFFNISDSDIAIATYLMQTAKVKVYVFTVSKDDAEHFEFSRYYTSELYNIHQIKEEYTWQCFSYNSYDGTEYTSAVLTDKNMVYEITFENCDEQFICNTLAAYS